MTSLLIENPARALEAIKRVQSARDCIVMRDLLDEAREALGVRQAVFVSFIKDDANENFRILLAGNPNWCLAYQERHWFAHDAWLLYAAAHSEPVSDAAIPMVTNGQRQARALSAEFGMTSAYVVPAPAATGLRRIGVLVLGSDQEGFFDSPSRELLKILARALAMELHEWWVNQMRDELIRTNGLTELDLRLLDMAHKGSCAKEMSRALGMSKASIDNRFQRLNAKFGMPNRRATSRLAREHGLI